VLVDVAGGRRAAELLPQAPEEPEQLVARREAARHEAGCALRSVPRAEVLDHGLRMDGGRRVARELAHGR